jgi:hypothetical protein
LWTVHLCSWIGTGAPHQPDMRLLGQHLARLHLAMAESSVDVTDRRLTFERSPAPSPDQDLPSWDIARYVWRDRVLAWVSLQSQQDLLQPIHGDLHWGNIVATGTGFGFIDFDKLAFAPPVFDLAKLIATGMFSVGERSQFHAPVDGTAAGVRIASAPVRHRAGRSRGGSHTSERGDGPLGRALQHQGLPDSRLRHRQLVDRPQTAGSPRPPGGAQQSVGGLPGRRGGTGADCLVVGRRRDPVTRRRAHHQAKPRFS